MADPVVITRLHPGPSGPTAVTEAYLGPRPDAVGRPWVGVCMIASVDGATAVAGRSGGLGNATDRAVLATVRRAADVVLVGAGTATAEGYGPPSKPGQRIGVVTNSGHLDPSTELFASGAGFAVAPLAAPVPDGIDVLRAGSHTVDLHAAVARLGDIVPGVRFASAEGGPQLNGALLAAGLIDEVNLTIAPTLVGGVSARLTAGAAEMFARLQLAHLAIDTEAYLFARYVRTP